MIEDKQRTPFNIGKAISLKGFQIHEVEPLERGLEGKFSDSQAVMQEILYWTGGQPFLTQKLCQFMVEESSQDNPRTVEQVVRSRIVESWESQDEPEHLRTIRARILRDEQRAGYLLELYQQVRSAEGQSELQADDTLEQSELQLSGLVVRQHNKLRVYNAIYQEIFDQNWIENQLKNLRPYSENFRFWVASGGTDESRLLRGLALQEAIEWADDKDLSYQDKQYLAASKEKEIQEEIIAKEKEAALERERKDREATEERNQVLSEANQTLTKANQKAKQLIRIVSGVLVMTLVGAVISIIWAGKDIQEIRDDTAQLQQLSDVSQKLDKKDKSSGASMAREKIGLSYEIKNHDLKKAMLFASISQAYQQLGEWDKADDTIKKSLNILDANQDISNGNSEGLQLKVLTQKLQGDLQVHTEKMEESRKFYEKAFVTFKNNRTLTSPFIKSHQQLITAQDIEKIHRQLIDLPSNNQTKPEFKKEDIEKSLTEHLYAQLEDYLNAKKWEEADSQTYRLMLNIAKREKERFLDYDQINSFSCPDLRRIDKLWFNSDNRFGFRVQKEIWIKYGNRLGIKPGDWTSKDNDNYLKFATAVGWYNDKKTKDTEAGGSRSDLSYEELMEGIKRNPTRRGTLPKSFVYNDWIFGVLGNFCKLLFSHCDL